MCNVTRVRGQAEVRLVDHTLQPNTKVTKALQTKRTNRFCKLNELKASQSWKGLGATELFFIGCAHLCAQSARLILMVAQPTSISICGRTTSTDQGLPPQSSLSRYQPRAAALSSSSRSCPRRNFHAKAAKVEVGVRKQVPVYHHLYVPDTTI